MTNINAEMIIPGTFRLKEKNERGTNASLGEIKKWRGASQEAEERAKLMGQKMTDIPRINLEKDMAWWIDCTPRVYTWDMWFDSANDFSAGYIMWLIPLMVWDAIWKGIGLWHAARNGQKNWFVALLVINSVGILPIIYYKFFQKKTEMSPKI